jgi:SAM-dependent methyltransferase
VRVDATLDDPSRIHELRRIIARKSSLRAFYREVYARYAECLAKCPSDGVALELGSGGGFARDVIPELVTSDTLPYDGVDKLVDATQMPFADASVRAIFMLNVFHHIPDVEAFLREAARVLKPQGRMLIVDQHPGWIGRFVYRYLHHEPFDPKASSWSFDSSGPLSGANGALTWIVFQRDRERLLREHPRLRLERYEPHSPLRYWMAGGLKSWSLLPGWAWGIATAVDRGLVTLTPELGCFVDVEVLRI